MDRTTKSKPKTPVWVWVVIIILIILLIIIPIIVWFLTKGSGGPSGGTGSTCTTSANCATGLVCTSNVCSLPDCPKPGKPINLTKDVQFDNPNYTVTLDWDDVTNTTFYIIFVGGDDGFDPFTESLTTIITNESDFVFEDVSPGTDVYMRVLGFSEDCGGDEDNISDQIFIQTSPIM